MPKVKVNGAELWYQFSGEGSTIVQIGGAVSAHEGYATITPGLSQHYRVLDYDHRGYGSSDRPAQHYTLDTWSDDLAGLMDALELERAHIHGGSMGSFIAVNFAARYPGRVDKLLLGAGAVGRCDRIGGAPVPDLAEPGPSLRRGVAGAGRAVAHPTPSRAPFSTVPPGATTALTRCRKSRPAMSAPTSSSMPARP